MSTVRAKFAERMGFVRLRGPLEGNPTANLLHVLLVGLLLWTVGHTILFVATPFILRRAVSVALLLYLAISAIIALLLLRRGSLHNASIVYLWGVGLLASVLVCLSGGSRSPALVLYAAIPISAAWLLGYRAALITSLACLLIPLGMGIAETLGDGFPRYFTGTPLSSWSIFFLATIIAALPVLVVLRTLNESLVAAHHWISELRQTQDDLRRERDLVNRIMETSPVGIVAVDREGAITFVNSSGERIFGATRHEILRRAYNAPEWKATSHEGSPYPDDEHPFRQVQQSGRALHDVRLAISKPDGRRVLLSVNAAPVWSADGKFEGMVASLEDMTERARVEDELRRYREGLEELVRQRTGELVAARDHAMAANNAKSVFLANVSHELRTPLNAILGFAGLIADSERVPPEHLAKLRVIQRSGEHLLELINDVLDMAEIEAGGFTTDISSTDLNDLSLQVVDMMRTRAEVKGLSVLVEQTPAFPRFARTDAAKLRQILINLVSNAVRYTEQGHVTLRLDAETTGRLLLKLEVADTGIGIAAEDQERIFKPFVRLAGSHPGGTGLGLALTRQYVQLMGGRISVESALGRGSVFRVVLPAEVSDTESAAPDLESARVIGLAPGQPRYRVLIVEDEQENRMLLEELLAGAGFDVRAAADGAAAVGAFQSWQPNFIWMDWRMPVMDGGQATSAIRAMEGGRQTKIAAVTASAFADERAAILAAGVDEFVRKPFRPEDIFECMARLLGVRYTFGKRGAVPEQEADLSLTSDALAVLPERLRQELADALLSLDKGRVTEVIRRASELDKHLGATLSRHADSLAFTPIFKALEALREHVGEEAI